MSVKNCIKTFSSIITLLIVMIPHISFAVDRPEEWIENFTVNGHLLEWQDTYFGSYQGYDSEDNILLIQQYGAAGQDGGQPGTVNDVYANAWFLERDAPGSIITLQFLDGNPIDGFIDCTGRAYVYYPWGAPAIPPAHYVTDPAIINLEDRDLDLRLAGEYVSGRFTNTDYPIAEQSCIVLQDVAAPTISKIDIDLTGETSAKISWQTNESATSTISYGTRSGQHTSQVSIDNATTNHSVFLRNLTNDSTYYFVIAVTDIEGNTTTTSEQTFETDSKKRSSGQNIHKKQLKNTTPNPNTQEDIHKYSFDIDLRIGMINPDVKLLQQFLNASKFTVASSGPGSVGSETDYFGRYTFDALKKYQAAKMLPPTGFFGPMTKVLINGL